MSDDKNSRSTADQRQCCSFCGKAKAPGRRLIAGASSVAYICSVCVRLCHELLCQEDEQNASPPEQAQTQERVIIPPKPAEIKKFLDTYVIGQEAAKKTLSVAVYNHYKRLSPAGDVAPEVELGKSNVLLIGSTGSGKTLLAQTLARLLDVPLAIADATTLTEAGYVGDDVENILQKLLRQCDYDVRQAQRGIIYVDEIDKVARKSENPSITRDVSGEGVQQALLKLIEGTVTAVPPQGGRKHPQQEALQIDTSDILFIVGGAFAGLEDIVRGRLDSTGIGFNADIRGADQTEQVNELFAQVQPKDLMKYGLIPELIGRLPVTVALRELDEEDLVRVLSEPRNALVKQYQKLFAMENIELAFQTDALRAIARKAVRLKTGARGLRSILEELLLDLMFELPSEHGVRRIVVGEDNVFEGTRPSLVYQDAVADNVRLAAS